MKNNSSWINQLKYRWCNIHPYSEAIPIMTKDGSKYWICLDKRRPINIYIEKNARSCGVIRLIWDEEHLGLCDFYIKPNYRGKGLGTKLLSWLILYASQDNIHQIEALVIPENNKDYDRLMSWYLRQGFYRGSPERRSIIMDL